MRILIADDDPCYVASTNMFLLRRGYDVCGTATNSNEIIELSELEKPDLILMDLNMPGDHNGLEAALTIYEKFNIPSILVSSDIPVFNSSNRQNHAFTYYRKNEDYEQLDFAIKQTRSRKDQLDFYTMEYNIHKEILNDSPFGMIIIDSNAKIAECNSAFARALSGEVEDFLEMKIDDIIKIDSGKIDHKNKGMKWYLSYLKSMLPMGSNIFQLLGLKGSRLAEVFASTTNIYNELYVVLHINFQKNLTMRSSIN